MKISIMVLLAFSLASCGPAVIVPNEAPTISSNPTSVSTLHPPPSSMAQVQQPVPWPGLHGGWMNFSGLGQSMPADFTYDSSGYLWALRNGGIIRWNLETGEMISYTALDGIPGDVRYLTMFKGKPYVFSAGGEVATYSGGKWILSPDWFWGASQYSVISNAGDSLWYSNWNSIQSSNGAALSYVFDVKTLPQCHESFTINQSRGGYLWFLGCRQVIRYDGRTWKSYDNLRGAQQILTLSDGSLIFEINNTLVHFDGNSFDLMVIPGKPFGFTLSGPPHLTFDGDVWFQIEDDYAPGVFDEVYVIHNGGVQELQFPPLPRGGGYPTSIVPVAVFSGRAVFYSSNNAAYLYDGKNWNILGASTDPWSDVISSPVIGFAPDGALWVDKDDVPERFDGSQLISPFQRQISQDQNRQCFGSNNLFVVDSKGSIWSWSPGTPVICYFDAITDQVQSYTLYFNVSQLIAAPAEGSWALSDTGFITNLTPDILASGDFRKITRMKIGGDASQSIVDPIRIKAGLDGSVLVLVKNRGLFLYGGGGWKYIEQATLQNATDLTVDKDGAIWVLCNSAEKYSAESLQKASFRDCTMSQDFTITPDGAVWFTAENGRILYRTHGSNWARIAQDQERIFSPNQIIVAPDGALWFIGQNIWTRYMP